MDLLDSFLSRWKEAVPDFRSRPYLLAISGGLDSCVLADLLRLGGLDFKMAHVNFGLRGQESDRDEAFVRQLAEDRGIPLFVTKIDAGEYASNRRLSIQEAARDLRYAWFRELASGLPGTCILTAHQADDNTETMLLRVFRGTGIGGLRGIPQTRELYRPLLSFYRNELLEYATQRGLQWVEDSSNSSDKYARNFVRNRLMPLLREQFLAVDAVLQADLALFSDGAAIYLEAVRGMLSKLATEGDGVLSVPAERIGKHPHVNALIWELIRPLGFGSQQVAEARKLLSAVTGSNISSATHRIIKDRKSLLITTLHSQTASVVLIAERETASDFAGGSLQMHRRRADGFFLSGPHGVSVDAGLLEFPLVFRKWRPGDYFYPFGLNKKKKLARFLLDQKLSVMEKECVWVLLSGEKIVWVAGQRLDHRFALTGKTTEVMDLRITFRNKR